MKSIIAVLCLLGLAAIAHADEKPTPTTKATHLSEADSARLERAKLLAENAKLRYALAVKSAQQLEALADEATRAFDAVAADVRRTYELGLADDVDFQTREITRQPKPATTKAPQLRKRIDDAERRVQELQIKLHGDAK